jgi:hypothetical protein
VKGAGKRANGEGRRPLRVSGDACRCVCAPRRPRRSAGAVPLRLAALWPMAVYTSTSYPSGCYKPLLPHRKQLTACCSRSFAPAPPRGPAAARAADIASFISSLSCYDSCTLGYWGKSRDLRDGALVSSSASQTCHCMEFRAARVALKPSVECIVAGWEGGRPVVIRRGAVAYWRAPRLFAAWLSRSATHNLHHEHGSRVTRSFHQHYLLQHQQPSI